MQHSAGAEEPSPAQHHHQRTPASAAAPALRRGAAPRRPEIRPPPTSAQSRARGKFGKFVKFGGVCVAESREINF